MPDIRKRWEHYRSYGRTHGLSPEDAEDFAQEAYLRYLKAGVEIVVRFVFIDYLRTTIGRHGKRNMARIKDPPGEPPWEILETIKLILSEAPAHHLSRRTVLKRLARHLGMTLNELKAII